MKLDRTNETLRELTKPRPEFPYLDAAQVFPRYDGRSVANIPAAIARCLGAEPGRDQLPPLLDAELFGADFDHVIVVLVDGIGDKQLGWLRAMLPDNPYFRRVEADGIETRLTSIVPSSTAAATTSIWTGVPAGRHGLIGYDTFLKDYGLVVNFLAYSPISLMAKPGLVELTGKGAEDMIGVETMGEILTRQGIAVRSYLPIAISASCLSRAQMRGAEIIPYRGFADLFATAEERISAEADVKSLDFIYYNDFDTYNHLYGMRDERIWRGMDDFLNGLERMITAHQAKRIGKTLVLLTADHGHTPTTPDRRRDWNYQPELMNLLTLRPTGENRLTYFHPKSRKADELIRRIEAVYPGEFNLVESERFLNDGFFGTGTLHPDVENRIGELIAIAKGDAFLWWNPRPDRLHSRHGGLSADEMIVPLIGLKL